MYDRWFTIALLTSGFGQVWAEHMCHDIMPQLWRRLEGKRSIQGDNCNKVPTSEDLKGLRTYINRMAKTVPRVEFDSLQEIADQ